MDHEATKEKVITIQKSEENGCKSQLTKVNNICLYSNRCHVILLHSQLLGGWGEQEKKHRAIARLNFSAEDIASNLKNYLCLLEDQFTV